MYGVTYWINKSRMTRAEVARRAHMAPATLKNLEQDEPHAMSAIGYMKLAAVLGVDEPELMRCYDESELGAGEHHTHASRRPPIGNCLDIYCARHNLRYRQMAELLGVSSRQAAQQACIAKKPSSKHIGTLSRLEGITPQEFLSQYAPDGRNVP